MHLTLVLLGTLFALHPLVEKIQHVGFDYGFDENKIYLSIGLVYGVLAGLVALVVYFYSLMLLSARWAGTAERLGNYIYAVALLLPPFYGGLYLAYLLENQLLKHSDIAWVARVAPWVPLGLGVFWLLVTQAGALWLRGRLSAQDVASRMSQLVEREAEALNRAQEMFAGDHFDLAVIESWKALETRLQRALLAHDYHEAPTDPERLLTAAQCAGILDAARRERVHQVLQAWHVAIGSEPTARESADKALLTTRDILSTIPVLDMRRVKRPAAAA